LDERNIPIIKNIQVTDMDTGITKTIVEEGNLFTIKLSNTNISQESHFKIVIYCASDNTTGFCADGWIPYEGTLNKTLTVSPGIKIVSRLKPITLVDLSTLIYDTPVNNDSRVAFLEGENGDKFLVVKSPSKDIFPGYYFNSILKKYIEDNSSKNENIGHWIRRGLLPIYDSPAVTYIPVNYTTGSDIDGHIYKYDYVTTDDTWNDGTTLPEFPNSSGASLYSHHSTYGYPLNINKELTTTLRLDFGSVDPRAPSSSGFVGSNDWIAWVQKTYSDDYISWNDHGFVETTDTNRGFLFYDTAENLPAFYSITYKLSKGSSELNKRFLYKLELVSDDDKNSTPVVKSVRFTINDRI
jgi:hypothetical protein